MHRGKDENQDEEEDNEPNENDDEQTQAKKARKKKEKRRGDAASTLATLDQIDAAEVDEAATDVLFSRLSRSGGGGLTDGTSARAMLLLRLAAEGACVSFGDAGAVDDEAVDHGEQVAEQRHDADGRLLGLRQGKGALQGVAVQGIRVGVAGDVRAEQRRDEAVPDGRHRAKRLRARKAS